MLLKLQVNNYVLIESLSFEPGKALNTITGETGAGKSILIGALGLILGDRADSKSVAGNTEKCIIEGTFDLRLLHLKEFFTLNDLDYADQTILRREITNTGRSRAFINDTPVSLNVLKELGEQLVDIHSQHQIHQIADSNFLFKWLDAVCQTTASQNDYSEVYQLLRNKQKEKLNLEELASKEGAQADYNHFLWEELDKAVLKLGELTQLEEEGMLLEHAEEIGFQVGEIQQSVVEDENSMVDRLKYFGKNLLKLAPNGSILSKVAERLQNLSIEMEDVVAELRQINESMQTDSVRLEEINQRRNLLQQLISKHRVADEDGLIIIRDTLSDNLYQSDSRKAEIEKLDQEIQKLELKATEMGEALHLARLKQIGKVSESMNRELSDLGLPNAKVELHCIPTKELNLHGKSSFQILFSSNIGQALQPAHLVASGGELSRLMLIIKAQMAKKQQLPCVIFDEIDTGVSGEIAKRMAEVMSALSSDLQVIAITHLPQIAAKGADHFYVFKETTEGNTKTQIRALRGEERVVEIAKMLSGDVPSAGALINAQELLVSA